MTESWIRATLEQGALAPGVRDLMLPLHDAGFLALLPLLRHGGLDDKPSANESLGGGLLENAFIGSRSERFVTDAGRLAGDGMLGIRRCDVCLRTENPLTTKFAPPTAREVGKALQFALESIDCALQNWRGDAGRSVVCALLGAQILLTIHPFRDGNGRTARMFFAAKVRRHIGPAPTALLAMLLMQRSGAHQYHQAMWALRAGDPDAMVDLFVDAERLAIAQILPALSDVQLPHGFLDECRGGVQAQL